MSMDFFGKNKFFVHMCTMIIQCFWTVETRCHAKGIIIYFKDSLSPSIPHPPPLSLSPPFLSLFHLLISFSLFSPPTHSLSPHPPHTNFISLSMFRCSKCTMAGRAGISQTQTHSLPLTPTICTLKTTGNAHTTHILGWLNALYSHVHTLLNSYNYYHRVSRFYKYGWPRHEAHTAVHSVTKNLSILKPMLATELQKRCPILQF